MAIGPHNEKVNRVGARIGPEHLSDRTTADLHRLKAGLDSVRRKVAHKGCSGFPIATIAAALGSPTSANRMSLIAMSALLWAAG